MTHPYRSKNVEAGSSQLRLRDSMAWKATKVTMRFFSFSENQLLNIYQHTIDKFIRQNWNNFVYKKKPLSINKAKAKQTEKDKSNFFNIVSILNYKYYKFIKKTSQSMRKIGQVYEPIFAIQTEHEIEIIPNIETMFTFMWGKHRPELPDWVSILNQQGHAKPRST